MLVLPAHDLQTVCLMASERLRPWCLCCCLPPDLLPTPMLVLQRQEEVWRLLCTGSPSYPGAVFSLYLGTDELPVATHRAASIHHKVTFSVPVQDVSVGLYGCQYSVLLGDRWSHSNRSAPLLLTKGELSKSVRRVSGIKCNWFKRACVCFRIFSSCPFRYW